jgi:hypothetical protein
VVQRGRPACGTACPQSGRRLTSFVEAVGKALARNRTHDAQKTISQNALHSTLLGSGGVKGPRELAPVIGKRLFLQPR